MAFLIGLIAGAAIVGGVLIIGELVSVIGKIVASAKILGTATVSFLYIGAAAFNLGMFILGAFTGTKMTEPIEMPTPTQIYPFPIPIISFK